ncbi:MAG TPA: hypothetical protein VJT12_01410 [Methyloceanibacter sp.]|jgi:hypothetical protein|nr:hypothetical protein [Methyloceanibacter sp.]
MSTSIAGAEALPKPPARSRAVAIMACIGVLTGLISTLPSPLPDVRLEDPEFLINARGVPLHAAIAFGAGLAAMLWLWVRRDIGKCLLTIAFTIIGWLVAANTANDVFSAVVSSELFGTEAGAKASREVVGWVLAGLVGGGIGAGLIAFGVGIAARSARNARAWLPIVVTGALFGLFLYPAARFDAIALLFVPWQAAVAAAIAVALTRHTA